MVTWAQLGELTAGLLGLVLFCGGILMVTASGMSSVPDDDLSKKGCGVSILGLALIIASLFALL